MSENLNIEFAKNSEKIMRVSLRDQVQKRGVDILECLLDFYNQDIIEEKNKSAVQTEAFIIDRLAMINNELKDVETRLQQYRQAHNITDIQVQSALNLNLQSDYEKERAEVEAEMAIYDAIQRIVSNSDTYESLPSAVNDPTITTVIEDYNRKVGLLNRQLEGSTPGNPLVVSMQQELSRDKTRILQNLSTARRNLQTKHSSIQRLENRSTGNLASTPGIDKGFQEIFREQQVKVNIYTFLLIDRAVTPQSLHSLLMEEFLNVSIFPTQKHPMIFPCLHMLFKGNGCRPFAGVIDEQRVEKKQHIPRKQQHPFSDAGRHC